MDNEPDMHCYSGTLEDVVVVIADHLPLPGGLTTFQHKLMDNASGLGWPFAYAWWPETYECGEPSTSAAQHLAMHLHGVWRDPTWD